MHSCPDTDIDPTTVSFTSTTVMYAVNIVDSNIVDPLWSGLS